MPVDFDILGVIQIFAIKIPGNLPWFKMMLTLCFQWQFIIFVKIWMSFYIKCGVLIYRLLSMITKTYKIIEIQSVFLIIAGN